MLGFLPLNVLQHCNAKGNFRWVGPALLNYQLTDKHVNKALEIQRGKVELFSYQISCELKVLS